MKVLPPTSSAPNALKPGDRAPAFELVHPTEGLLRAETLLQSGPVLLTFYRGAWCGCCKTDLRDVTDSMSFFDHKDISVFGVFHGLDKDSMARIRQTYNLGFPLVDDPDGNAARAFGIRRTDKEIWKIENEFGPDLIVLQEGQPWIMPMQARFMIGTDGIIAHADVVADYNDRSTMAELKPVVEAL